jgi:hypothetical protein
MNDQTNVVAIAAVKLSKYVNLTWFKAILDGWSTSHSGPKPTSEQLATALLIDPKGKRPGVEALHIAMCLRDGGCTVRQFQIAGSCGPANNYRRALVNAKLVKGDVVGKPYAYTLTVTPKGQASIDRAVAAAQATASEPKAKVVKATKASAKPKGKGKGKPATPVAATPVQPTSEPPTVTVSQPATEATSQPTA